MSDSKQQDEHKTVENGDGQSEKSKEKRLGEYIHLLKGDKCSAKSRMTRLLNNMAAIVYEASDENTDVGGLLLHINKQKEETLEIMNQLEKVYEETGDNKNAMKVGDEADALVDQVEKETSSARLILMSARKQRSSLRHGKKVKDMKKQEEAAKQSTEKDKQMEANIQKEQSEVGEQERQLQAAKEVAGKSCQDLSSSDEEIQEIESNKQKDKQSKTIQHQAQLERIRISVFSGNKMDFQRWHAAFTSCVDSTSLSSQFKMLRLESCLTGEAADTIRGLGYSAEEYEAAKAPLVRKYGGSRRQVQSYLEELKKLKPIEENNSKELERFADILERAVITLKENGCESDLESGTLHTIILEKIPECLLAQYYRWIKENHYKDSLEKLKDWVLEEAEYQMQATEIKRRISLDGERRREKKYVNR